MCSSTRQSKPFILMIIYIDALIHIDTRKLLKLMLI